MLTKLSDVFYQDADNGHTALPIWIAGFLSLLAAWYIPTGLIYQILGYLSSVTEKMWLSPYNAPTGLGFYPNSKPVLEILVHFFAAWVPTTIFLGLGLWFVQRKLRDRPIKNIITSAKKFRWKRFAAAIVVFLGLTIVFWFLQSVWNSNNQSILNMSTSPRLDALGLEWVGVSLIFLIGLPFILIFTPLDAAMQEIVFRGFGDQALCKFLPSQTLAFTVSAALFALWHFGNTEMYYGFLPYFLSLFGFGLMASILTSMDGGLEAAIGIHVINNLFFF